MPYIRSPHAPFVAQDKLVGNRHQVWCFHRQWQIFETTDQVKNLFKTTKQFVVYIYILDSSSSLLPKKTRNIRLLKQHLDSFPSHKSLYSSTLWLQHPGPPKKNFWKRNKSWCIKPTSYLSWKKKQVIWSSLANAKTPHVLTPYVQHKTQFMGFCWLYSSCQTLKQFKAAW